MAEGDPCDGRKQELGFDDLYGAWMRAKTSSPGKNERTRGYETGQLGKPAAKGENVAIWNEIKESRRVELDLADVVGDEESKGMW